MPRLQVYLPDDLYRQLKRHKLSPSELLQGAVIAEIDRRRKLDQLDEYLADLRREVGPSSRTEEARAAALVGRIDARARRPRTRRAS